MTNKTYGSHPIVLAVERSWRPLYVTRFVKMAVINTLLLLKTKFVLVLTVYVLREQKAVGKFDVDAVGSIYVPS